MHAHRCIGDRALGQFQPRVNGTKPCHTAEGKDQLHYYFNGIPSYFFHIYHCIFPYIPMYYYIYANLLFHIPMYYSIQCHAKVLFHIYLLNCFIHHCIISYSYKCILHYQTSIIFIKLSACSTYNIVFIHRRFSNILTAYPFLDKYDILHIPCHMRCRFIPG